MTRDHSINPCNDRNVEAVVIRHRDRAAHGLAKYGTTTERQDLTLAQWIQHAQDESMDHSIYLERLKGIVAALEAENAHLKTELAGYKSRYPGPGSIALRNRPPASYQIDPRIADLYREPHPGTAKCPKDHVSNATNTPMSGIRKSGENQ